MNDAFLCLLFAAPKRDNRCWARGRPNTYADTVSFNMIAIVMFCR